MVARFFKTDGYDDGNIRYFALVGLDGYNDLAPLSEWRLGPDFTQWVPLSGNRWLDGKIYWGEPGFDEITADAVPLLLTPETIAKG